jgi:hypothetical protein
MARRVLGLLTVLLAAACTKPSSSNPTPPAAPVILVPTNGAILGLADLTAAGQVTFSGTAQAGTSVSLEVDGVGVCTAATSGSSWSCSANLADGTHTARARATDAGGTSGYSSTVGFTLYAHAPATPTVLVPAAGAHLAAPGALSTLITISGTATAGIRVDVQLLDVDHLTTPLSTTIAADGNGAWTTHASVTVSARYTARARAVDAAGNASQWATSTFTMSLARTASVDSSAPVPVTNWAQTVADAAGLAGGEVFPGQANTWVVDTDFALGEGWGAQYTLGLQLSTGTVTTPVSHASLYSEWTGAAFMPFPADQAETEVTFLSPRFVGTTDGVVTAAASDGFAMGITTIAGAYSGFLNGTPDSRLSQAVTFSAGVSYTISWTQEAFLWVGNLVGAAVAPYAPLYQVVLRDPSNDAILQTLFSSTADVVRSPETHTVSFGVTTQALLSFELRGEAKSYAEIDLVDVNDGTSTNLIVNPGFETGVLDPWVANSGAESQNVQSGSRLLALDPLGAVTVAVTRTIYSPPNETFARVVDVFENDGLSTVAGSAVYQTFLAGAVPLAAVDPSGAWVVGWDATGASRDVGHVVGNGAAYVAAADPYVYVVHDLVVPPHGKVAVVQFVVQLGEAAGGITVANVPANTNAACGDIANGFPAADKYWRDLEPGVMQVIQNF